MKFYALGLTGFPLEHSLSPCLQRQFLQNCGLQGDYRLYPLAPEDQNGLQTLLAALRQGNLDGLNVTIPHKQTLFRLVDDLTPAARAIGAVNTLFFRAGRLTGENTDAPAFWNAIASLEVEFPRRQALLLGAGGAARAALYALRQQGWQVTVASRRAEPAQALAQQFDAAFCPFSALGGQQPDLLVNATPAGMYPRLEDCPWPQEIPLPDCSLVYDLIYNPSETLLLRRARQQGLNTLNGWPMLTHQAALAFKIWTGCAPSLKGLAPC